MHHDDEAPTNLSGNPYFGDVLQAAVSRRSLLQGGVGAAGMALLGGVAFLAPGTAQAARKLKLGFDAVAKNLLDAVTVPPGYSARALFRTGDPIASGVAAYLNDGTDADMHLRAGDQHDAIAYYGLGGNNQWAPGNSSRGLLAMNFENIDRLVLHGGQPAKRELSSPSMVGPLDPRHDREPELLPRRPDAAVQDVLLQQREEALHRGVVPSSTDATHRSDHPLALDRVHELP